MLICLPSTHGFSFGSPCLCSFASPHTFSKPSSPGSPYLGFSFGNSSSSSSSLLPHNLCSSAPGDVAPSSSSITNLSSFGPPSPLSYVSGLRFSEDRGSSPSFGSMTGGSSVGSKPSRISSPSFPYVRLRLSQCITKLKWQGMRAYTNRLGCTAFQPALPSFLALTASTSSASVSSTTRSTSCDLSLFPLCVELAPSLWLR